MKERVLAVLERDCPDIDFTASDKLVTDGLIDSLVLTEIIMALTIEFGIEIPYGEIVKANFDSVDGMTAMVERLMK